MNKPDTYNILLIGLGNPGKKYEGTRHNVGFMYLDHIDEHMKALGFAARTKEVKDVYRIVSYDMGSLTFTLLYPLTYMNRAGQAVSEYLKYHSCDTIYLAHDDLDIALGKYKIQLAKGPKQHNGILSVEQLMGSKEFDRIRIGVDNRHKQPFNGSGADYVLDKFSREEMLEISQVLKGIEDNFIRIFS